ncbi:MAG: 2-amino-4-hydroxy-6-hydroxymethyldihydropteridine diphosphokinase [Hyphomicrobium sp.]
MALGSNLGDKTANIDTAIALHTEVGDVRLLARSRNYANRAVGEDGSGLVRQRGDRRRDSLSPRLLLARCKDIERRMGRVETERWGPRIIDLDLLVYRGISIDEPDLVLPHPHIGARAFVLAPLLDIDPDLVIGDRSVRAMYEAIDTSGVRALD